VESEVLSSSPWDSVIGHLETVQSCIRGCSDFTLGSFCSFFCFVFLFCGFFFYRKDGQTLEQAS